MLRFGRFRVSDVVRFEVQGYVLNQPGCVRDLELFCFLGDFDPLKKVPFNRVRSKIILPTVDDINPAFRTLNYGNNGIFLVLGIAGFVS